ncbi:MAG: hypothetical protein JNL98_24315 [Bryobacterales bacterium]|nr:hypothetical protein [Bryobacterales bacterium]
MHTASLDRAVSAQDQQTWKDLAKVYRLKLPHVLDGMRRGDFFAEISKLNGGLRLDQTAIQ